MQKYLLLNEKLRNACEQLNQLSLGLIKLKQNIEEILPQLEDYRQTTEEAKRTYLSAYERLTLRLIKILNDFNLEEPKRSDAQNRFDDFIKARLEDTLRREGVTLLEVQLREQVNLDEHEVVDSVIDNEKPEGTIIKILNPGYIRNSKIIKRAQVVVTQREG